MARNRKIILTSGPATKGQVDFRPLSGDTNPTKGVIIQGPDSVGATALTLTLPSSVAVNRVLVTDASGNLSFTLLTNSNLNLGLTASRAVVSDASGNLISSLTTDTEIGYLSGVTSSIQTQINTEISNRISGDSTNATNLSNHIADTAAHGATGAVVGTTNTQTLTNKTLTAPIISTIVNTGTLTLPTSTDTLVGRATTDTLTNKTLSGNTATNLINGTGTFNFNSSGTLTAPNATDTLVGKNTTDTLTNKTIDTATNTIKSDSATSGQVLTADGAGNTSWSTPSSAPSSSLEFSNGSITASVAGNALTIALKDASGADPSAGSPVKIGFRSSTATSGAYNQRSITSALSMVVSSGSTLGQNTNDSFHYVHVYAIDTGAGVVLGVSSAYFDEGSLQSSTAEGGTGTADNANILYSTAAQTSKPIRYLGRLTVNETTLGTWASAPTEISTIPLNRGTRSQVHYYTGNGYGSTNTRIRRFLTKYIYLGDAITFADSAANGSSFTINEPGVYSITYSDDGVSSGGTCNVSVNAASLTTAPASSEIIVRFRQDGIGGSSPTSGSACVYLNAGDIVRAHNDDQSANSTTAGATRFNIIKVSN